MQGQVKCFVRRLEGRPLNPTRGTPLPLKGVEWFSKTSHGLLEFFDRDHAIGNPFGHLHSSLGERIGEQVTDAPVAGTGEQPRLVKRSITLQPRWDGGWFGEGPPSAP